FFLFFFFNDTATTEIYTLSLHDALPIAPSDSTLATNAGEPDALSTACTRAGGARKTMNAARLAASAPAAKVVARQNRAEDRAGAGAATGAACACAASSRLASIRSHSDSGGATGGMPSAIGDSRASHART